MSAVADAVQIDVDGPVLTITLNRPHVRNAIDLLACEMIAGGLARLERDPSLRVGIITGTGSTFCSGVDLNAADAGDSDAIGGFEPGGFAGFVRFARTKPVIGAAQGHAIAGGLEILLACDIAIGADDATFGLPEVRIGIIAAAGGTIALGRDFPPSWVMPLLLTGKPVDAWEARRIGLLSEVVERTQVVPRAEELAAAISEAAPLAVAATLQLARKAQAGACEEELQDLNMTLISGLLRSADATEGRRAFLAKRAPCWTAA